MKIGSCLPIVFSQVIYSGGYSDGEPPLPIPNREAKPVIADGTARPGGRVGSRRALKESSDEKSSGDSFSVRPARTYSKGCKSLNRPDSGKVTAKGKGVRRETESEGSQRQTSGLTDRNPI